MYIRQTTLEDYNEILKIYEHARKYMVSINNPNQWGNIWPPKELVKEDIINKKSYVCVNENEELLAVFFYDIMKDPTYNIIDGAWINDKEYGVVHRIAVKVNNKGIGRYCLEWAYSQCNNLRIDTHENNISMLKLLEKMNFKYCGIIKTHNGSPRKAFQLYGGKK